MEEGREFCWRCAVRAKAGVVGFAGSGRRGFAFGGNLGYDVVTKGDERAVEVALTFVSDFVVLDDGCASMRLWVEW
jgi:hypothetical protein